MSYSKFNTLYHSLGSGMDKINGVYDGSVPRNDKARAAVRNRVGVIVESASGSVLDIGCSGGIISVLMARNGCNIIAIDNMPGSLSQARDLKSEEEEAVQSRLVFQYGLAEYLEFPDASFDTVVMGEVLEHVISPRVVLTEAMRVLKPGGKFLCSVPVGYNRTVSHLRFFEEGNFVELLGEFCQVEVNKNFSDIQMLGICCKRP